MPIFDGPGLMFNIYLNVSPKRGWAIARWDHALFRMRVLFIGRRFSTQ